MVAIVGASGSGKSTLLAILGGMDVPVGRPGGRRRLRPGPALGHRADPLPAPGRRVRLAADRAQPAAVPQRGRERPAADGPRRPEGAPQRRRSSCSSVVGLGDRATHRPDRLSGGEQQRVAIAVALANDPIGRPRRRADRRARQPTSAEVFGLLRRVNKTLGTTIVIVTHDAFVSEQVQRTVAIRDGRTSTETLRRTEQTHEGDDRVIAEEYAVLDRAGRLQLPRAHVEALELQQPRPADARGRPRRHLAGRPTRDPAARTRGATGPGPMTESATPGPSARAAPAPTRCVVATRPRPRLRERRLGRPRAPRHRHRRRPRRAARGPRPVGLAARRRCSTCSAASTSPRRAPSSSTGRRSPGWARRSRPRSAGATIAFIFQTFGLIPILSAAENVEVPLRLVGADPRERDAPGRRAAGARRPRRAGAPPAARAVGRGAAAGRDRAGAGQPAAAPARRRADRPARLRDRASGSCCSSGRWSGPRA